MPCHFPTGPARLFRPFRLVSATFSLALRANLTHRANLVFDLAQSLVGIATLLVTTLVVFQRSSHLAGWSKPQVFVLIGSYAIISGVRRTFLDPSLSTLVDTIRTGTLDEVLLRPAPTWLMVTCREHAPLALGQSAAGLIILCVGLHGLPKLPGPFQVTVATVLLCCAIAMSWAFSLIVACLGFWAQRLEFFPLTAALWDVGRYPASIYQQPVSTIVTYVIPLAGMVTLPADALVHGHPWSNLATGLMVCLVLVLVARLVLRLGLARYTGATS